jgi:hypothetical protein
MDASSTPNLAQALLVPFAAGFAVQQLLEILDPIAAKLLKDPQNKKVALGLTSLVIGLLLSWQGGLRIMSSLGFSWTNPFWDYVITGVFISGGTEGFNSLLKFANYKKEASKADAAAKKSNVSPTQLAMVNRQNA